MKIQFQRLLEESLDSPIEHGLHTGIQFQLGKEVSRLSMFLCHSDLESIKK
jgi:hypothetical protein